MKRPLVIINTIGIVLIIGYLSYLGFNAFRSGYPWALLCYNCKSCNAACILGIDPQGFITAAYANDPDIYIYATNIRISLQEAYDRDPGMTMIADDDIITVREALTKRGIPPQTEIITYRMRARDAAKYCLDCGACDKACPIRLPISSIFNHLKKHDSFGEK